MREVKSKYRAVKTARVMPNGETRMFDSKKEAERFDELLQALNAGAIRNLKLQPEFVLQSAFTDPLTNERVRAITYRADFSYEKRCGAYAWRMVIEDAKGVRTKEYALKRKMMMERGYQITEV